MIKCFLNAGYLFINTTAVTTIAGVAVKATECNFVIDATSTHKYVYYIDNGTTSATGSVGQINLNTLKANLDSRFFAIIRYT